MRYRAVEKLEIIRLVEQSPLPVRHTLVKLGIPRATFYRWYDRYSRGGPEALNDRSPRPDRVWNRIPDGVRDNLPQLALDQPALSPSLERPLTAAGPRLEPHSGRRARQPHPARTRPAGAVAARVGRPLYRHRKLFCVRGFGLPPAESV